MLLVIITIPDFLVSLNLLHDACLMSLILFNSFEFQLENETQISGYNQFTCCECDSGINLEYHWRGPVTDYSH